MPTRNLGKTGYRWASSRWAAGGAREADNFDVAVPIIERALDLGVNYIDTSSIYGGPERWSEQYVAGDGETAPAGFSRDQNKGAHARRLHAHDREVARAFRDRSRGPVATARRGTMTDVNAIFAKGGAMEALVEMKEQKVVRCLGLTGHYRPDALMEGIRRYPFDTILMAMNAADPHYFSFNEGLLPLAVERQMGIIGMKVPGRSRLLSSWTRRLSRCRRRAGRA